MAKRRISWLDSIRGLAALSVVFSHFFLTYGFPAGFAGPLTSSPLHFFWDGFAGVSMFFVLSGYVLSRKYFTEVFPSWIRFAAARWARIWLPYMAALAFSYGLFILLPPRDEFFTIESPWLRSFWHDPVSFGRQALLLPNDGLGRLLPQDWTLSLEVAFSLALPPLVWVARRASWVFLVFGLASVLFWKLPILTFHFCLGILLARHEARVTNFLGTFSPRAACLAVGLALYTFRFSLPIWVPGIIPEQRIWYVTGLGAALLLAFALAVPAAQRWLSRPSLAYLGAISYAVYLTHFTVLLVFVPRALAWSRLAEPWQLRALAFPVCIGLTVALAHALHYFVDRPAIHFARRLLKSGRTYECPSEPLPVHDRALRSPASLNSASVMNEAP